MLRLLAVFLGFTAVLPAAGICTAIRRIVEAEAARQAVPAISFAVIVDHKVSCEAAYGWADREQRVPNTPRSRHRLASLAKPVSAVLTMMLAEERRLGLEDTVRQHLPEAPDRYTAMTIRHLLCHQSGIRSYAGLEEVFSTAHYTSLTTASEAIFLSSPLLFPPGTRTAYTTYGYTLLGAILERVTERPFGQLLHERLPGFALDDSRAVTPQRVRPYRGTPANTWENAPPFDASNKYPGGGIISTPRRYAEFLIAVAAGKLLRPQTVETMWARQTLSDGTLVPFATLGWATGVRDGHRFYTHGGLQPGTTTVMHWFPELGVGGVLLSNAEGPDLDRIQNRIVAVLLSSQP